MSDQNETAEQYNDRQSEARLEPARKVEANRPDDWSKKPVGTEISPGVYFDQGFIVVGDKL